MLLDELLKDCTSPSEKMYRFLEDTIEYYTSNKDSRSVDLKKGGCFYRSPTDQRCAIGRFIPEDLYSQDIEYSTIKALRRESDRINNLFKEFPTLFLSDIQDLHDTNYYWNDNKLTILGKEFIEGVKDRIATDYYFIDNPFSCNLSCS